MTCADSSFLLYAVTDRTWLNGRTLIEQVEDCLRGGATIVQLREKDLDEGAYLAEALEIKAICSRYRVMFLVNDAVDIAAACHADGVHIGQSDMDIKQARKKLGPAKIIGVSVQTVRQALQAEHDGADYLGVGSIFPTTTKADADAVPIDTLRQISDAVSIPVVAIGGINRHNIFKLKGTGIDGVAVISALFAEKDIALAARELLALSKETVAG